MKENLMRDIRIEKVVLNVGCGTKLKPETAKTMLEKITGKKAVITITRKRSTFNVPARKPIGCKVTVRKNSDEFLRRLLEAKEMKLKERNFDRTGNVSFGIAEYIDVPGMQYDHSLGILGFDVSVALERRGYRVKKKKLSKKIGKKHSITKQEAIDFVKNRFNVQIVTEKEIEEE
jgi:large subunit ribosomal protein L5